MNMNTHRRPIRTALAQMALATLCLNSGFTGAQDTGWPEKDELKFGFIKLTDMAPLAIALERGYFEDEFLYVELEAQSNWRVLLDRVISGELDGAHMLAGQPIAATIGYGNQANIVTPFSINLNGNATTLSNEVWDIIRPHLPENDAGNPVHPITADYLAPALEAFADQGKPFNLGMVFPVSTHNYELRYWLAAGGIHPGFYSPQTGDTSGQIGADVFLSVTPPPQMPATMEAGTISGYNVGEPWNQQAVAMGIGVPVVTNHDIWNYNPEKVFGLREDFVEQYPNTSVRLVKALIRAGKWLDENNNANRPEAVEILSQPWYVGADYEVIANSMTGTFEYERGDVRDVPDFNVFFRENATYPYYSDAIWFLTQMRRWGQIEEQKPDNWYMEMAKKVYRPDIYQQAARDLIAEGHMTASDFPDFATEDGFRPATDQFIDGITYDGRHPNAYLEQFSIGLSGTEQP